MLPELTRLVSEETHTVEAWRNGTRIISLSRREILYEAYLLLAVNYKIMADDWRLGAHCTSDLTKEYRLRRGFSLLSDGAQMMMCFMMGDDGNHNARPSLSMKAEIYDAVTDVQMVRVRTCTSRIVRDCVIHKLAMQLTNHIIMQ